MRLKDNKIFNIKNDIVFKMVFGREDETCKLILKDLINEILDLKGQKRIKNITYKNPFNLQEIPTDKLTIMDIKVETENGQRIDIEMQVGEETYFRKRSLYYWAKLYNETISNADTYNNLKKSIIINILNFNCIEESYNYHTTFQLLEKREHFLLTEDLEMHFIELNKIDDNKNVNEMTGIEQWVTFIKDSDNEKRKELIEELVKRVV